MMTKVLLTLYTNYFGRAHYSTMYMENVITLVKSDHYGFFFFYLVVVVGSSTGVQAGKKSLGLLLHTCRCWHGQE